MAFSSKDEYFKNYDNQPFSFNEKVVDVYDDMVKRSIPFYEEVTRITVELLLHYCPSNANIVNLGCATAHLENELLKHKESEKFHIDSYDLNQSMLEKAKKRLNASKQVSFHQANILDVEKNNVSAYLCNYTLQFTDPKKRGDYFKKLYKGLNPKGVFILSEKLSSPSGMMNDEFFYHNLKRRNGYSDEEIKNKKKSLENVLMPLSLEENMELLKKASFKHISIPFKWYNFASFLAIKDE